MLRKVVLVVALLLLMAGSFALADSACSICPTPAVAPAPMPCGPITNAPLVRWLGSQSVAAWNGMIYLVNGTCVQEYDCELRLVRTVPLGEVATMAQSVVAVGMAPTCGGPMVATPAVVPTGCSACGVAFNTAVVNNMVGAVRIAAGADGVFILRGGTLYHYDADLNMLKSVKAFDMDAEMNMAPAVSTEIAPLVNTCGMVTAMPANATVEQWYPMASNSPLVKMWGNVALTTWNGKVYLVKRDSVIAFDRDLNQVQTINLPAAAVEAPIIERANVCAVCGMPEGTSVAAYATSAPRMGEMMSSVGVTADDNGVYVMRAGQVLRYQPMDLMLVSTTPMIDLTTACGTAACNTCAATVKPYASTCSIVPGPAPASCAQAAAVSYGPAARLMGASGVANWSGRFYVIEGNMLRELDAMGNCLATNNLPDVKPILQKIREEHQCAVCGQPTCNACGQMVAPAPKIIKTYTETAVNWMWGTSGIAADQTGVYVLRGDRLYKYDLGCVKVLKSVKVFDVKKQLSDMTACMTKVEPVIATCPAPVVAPCATVATVPIVAPVAATPTCPPVGSGLRCPIHYPNPCPVVAVAAVPCGPICFGAEPGWSRAKWINIACGRVGVEWQLNRDWLGCSKIRVKVVDMNGAPDSLSTIRVYLATRSAFTSPYCVTDLTCVGPGLYEGRVCFPSNFSQQGPWELQVNVMNAGPGGTAIFEEMQL